MHLTDVSIHLYVYRLARQLQKEVQSTNPSDFTEDQKVHTFLRLISTPGELMNTHIQHWVN